jgi:hypothetical protein
MVEALFRALTDINGEGVVIRRPCFFGDLCAVAGASFEELLPILDAFRAPGVSFLTPSAPAPISEKTLIDINREVLIRAWRHLSPSENEWVKREFHDGLIWRGLLSHADDFVVDHLSFLSQSATERTSAWLKDRNEAWSERYGGGWRKVTALIEASREYWMLQSEIEVDRRAGSVDDELLGKKNICYYISYARADSKNEEIERVVDRFCEKASSQGIDVIRDKTALGQGDLISEFMREIGEGNLIFIFLSNKYLTSVFCMTELFEIWRTSQQNKTRFMRRVRIFSIDRISISCEEDWLKYADYWYSESKKLKNRINKSGFEICGEEVIRRYKMMKRFSDDVSDILALFANTVQASSFDEFLEHCFKDLPARPELAKQPKERGAPYPYA